MFPTTSHITSLPRKTIIGRMKQIIIALRKEKTVELMQELDFLGKAITITMEEIKKNELYY